MICGRCDKAILPGQPSRPYDIPSDSGPGRTVHLHVNCSPEPRR